jgi:hypothetical protein
VRDDDVAPPNGSTPEIRAEGLWSALECETPLEHWTVGLEAFAVALDDPDEALRGERGDRVGIGFDLEWEAAAAPEPTPNGFSQLCVVHGEVLVGRNEHLDITARGWRARSWGRVALPSPPAHGAARFRAPLMAADSPVVYELCDDAAWRRGQP